MLAAIFDADLDTFDLLTLIAAVVIVVGAVLARPQPNPPRASAWATTVIAAGVALGFFAFLFMTP